MRLLPHAHDYDMRFPDGGFRWCFTCKCGHVVFTQEAALNEMYWTGLSRRIGIMLWGLGVGCIGLFAVVLATAASK